MKIVAFTQRLEYWASQSRLVYFILSFYYRHIVKKEVRLAKISADDSVLCIGGGACPYTAILIAKYTGAAVTVIDNNADCVDQAGEQIKRLGLERVEVSYNEGAVCRYGGYSVIHLAMQISPKEAVLQKIHTEADPGTRVLVRNPKPALDKLNCPCRHEISCGVRVDHRLCNLDHTAQREI